MSSLDDLVQGGIDALDARSGGLGMRWYWFLRRGGLLAIAAVAIWQSIWLLGEVQYSIKGWDPAEVYAYYGGTLYLLDHVAGAAALVIAGLAIASLVSLTRHSRCTLVLLTVLLVLAAIVPFFYLCAAAYISDNWVMAECYIWPFAATGSLVFANWRYFQRRKAMFDA